MTKYSINAKELQDFCEKCDSLCSSKLILADKKISNLLKTIAASEDICIFLKDCLEGFNYKIEYLKSKQPDGEKKDKYIIALPTEKSLVAFVFCLLCEFENKEKDLTDFLIEFYDFNELFNDGFANFCNKVIIPFKNTVTALCSGETEEVIESVPLPDIEKITLDKEQYIKINKLCQELYRNINKEGALEAEERKEYLIVAKAFNAACKVNDETNISILLIALKHMCKSYRFLNNKTRQIEKLLKV